MEEFREENKISENVKIPEPDSGSDIPIPIKRIEDSSKKGVVETYATDLAEAIKDRGGITLKSILEEEERKEKEREMESPESKVNRIFLFSGIGLIVCATVLLGTIIFFRKDFSVTDVKPANIQSFIFSDQNKYIDISNNNKREVVSAIKKEVSSAQIKEGGIESIFLIERSSPDSSTSIVTLPILLSYLKSDLTTKLPDKFMLGIFSSQAKNNLFMLIEFPTFEESVKIMRSWEIKMLGEAGPLFEKSNEITSVSSGISAVSFEDYTFKNKNARVLKDKNGNILLMYIFAGKNSVIITGDSGSAEEALNRLYYKTVKR